MRLILTAMLFASPALAASYAPGASSGPTRAGATTSCIDRRLIETIAPDGDRALRFQMSRGLDFTAPTAGKCAFSPVADRFVVRGGGSTQLCEGEALGIEARSGGASGGACQIGRFTATERATRR